MDDERFQNIIQDPRFRKIPKNIQKLKIDQRFQKLLKNKQFKESSRIDERGRLLNLTASDNLKKLYNLKDSSEDDSSSAENSENDSPLLTEGQKKSSKINLSGKTKSVKGPLSGKTNLQKKNLKKLKESEMKEQKYDSSRSENLTLEDDLDSNEDDSSNDKPLGLKESDSEDIQGQELSAKDQKMSSKLSVAEKPDEKSDVSSEDSDDSDSEVDNNNSEFEHDFYERHQKAPDAEKTSKRFAVCNMDWDRIRAEDLYTVFNSFKPLGGIIHSVRIYPSEKGLKRMGEEKLKGPAELIEETLDPDEEEVTDKKKSKYHREKLRKYQFNRLEYFYAIVDCDSPETADHLVENLNLREYESCGLPFDLRFVPDDMTFDLEPVSEVCKAPDPNEYKPRLFVNTAAQQCKVDLTWDETDPRRREILEKAFTEPESVEKDVKDYLASSSEESEEELEDMKEEKSMKFSERITKYKELLQSLEEKEGKEGEKYEMEISWEPGLKEKTEKLVKEKMEDTNDTPFEEMLKKKKQERKLKKQEKKAKTNIDEEINSELDDSDLASERKPVGTNSTNDINELYLISDSKKAVNQTEQEKSKKRKKKKKNLANKAEETQDFQFVKDDRFSAIYTSHEYNIDPSDPHFKKTEGTMAIIKEKQKRLKNKESHSDEKQNNKKVKYR